MGGALAVVGVIWSRGLRNAGGNHPCQACRVTRAQPTSRIEGAGKAEVGAHSPSRGRSHRISHAIPSCCTTESFPTRRQPDHCGRDAFTWDDAQHCSFVPQTGCLGTEQYRTESFIAGDGAGIGGAKAAEYAGTTGLRFRVACQASQTSVYKADRDLKAATGLCRATCAKEKAARPFLDAAYPPFGASVACQQDNTVICRCEEITAGDIRSYANLGCLGPNQTKAFGRAGMGHCQGRYCGLTVTALLADANRQSPDETGYYRIRPPLKPVTLGELAAMDGTTQDAAE